MRSKDSFPVWERAPEKYLLATRRHPTLLHARFGGRRWGVLVRGVPRLPYETGPGLREGLQPRVERGRPWPARPTLRTRIALGRSTAIACTSMCVYSPRRCSCAPKRAPGTGDD